MTSQHASINEDLIEGMREGDTVTIFFTHRSTDHSIRSGSATSIVSRAQAGSLRLTEFYQFTPGKDEYSVCREISPS